MSETGPATTGGVYGLREAVAGVFDRSAQSYDAVGIDYFPLFARHLADDVAVASGEKVLDVGCGRGAMLFEAARRVGEAGEVTGIDISPGMIGLTAKDVEDLELGNVAVKVMDAQEPELPERSFDVLLSSCVVFFLPDPAAGVRAWRDLLRPGGRIGLTTFTGNYPRWSGIQEIFKPYVPPAVGWALVDPSSPFASTENFERMLASAGFADVRSVVREHWITFDDPEHWVRFSWSHGQRLFWEFIPSDLRDEVTAEVIAELEKLREPDGKLLMSQAVRYTTASRGPT